MTAFKKPVIKRLTGVQRKAASISQDTLIRTETFAPDQTLPLVICPAAERLNLFTWVKDNQKFIEANLCPHGGLLFRGFEVDGLDEFEAFMRFLAGGEELLEYTYRSTPRTQVSGKLYTSTEYPADHFIPLHNEFSYADIWPMKIGFFCVEAAEQGGETPVADARKVFARIDPNIRNRFREKKVMYVRNYGHRVDLPWQDVFQTTERTEVEAYCHKAGIEFEWKDGDGLKTRHVCRVVAKHPEKGEWVWFNQAHLFHVSSLPSEVGNYLMSAFGEEELPRNAYYGDGSPIEIEALDAIRAAYLEETVTFHWQKDDVLLLDNMLVAHGRAPYAGQRKIIVGMAEGYGDETPEPETLKNIPEPH